MTFASIAMTSEQVRRVIRMLAARGLISMNEDQAWNGVAADISPPAQEVQLDRRDTQILSLLSDGRTDATIARLSGISQRTVERRVRVLMNQLGAATRFQAGVQASRRGWI
jgi:DNA-binding NarL/FixJ family response regulator